MARNAKAMRLNRRQMFKNAPLEDSYEPKITTKQVSETAVKPEIELPCLKQSFQNGHGKNTQMQEQLNIITHSRKPLYQSYLTAEDEAGILQTQPRQQSFRRKSMVSRFFMDVNTTKNHKEFMAGQQQKPVALYGHPVGQFSQGLSMSNSFKGIVRS